MSEIPVTYPTVDRNDPPGEYIDFSDFFLRLRRRFLILLLCLIVGILAAAFVSSRTPPSYESEVRLLFPGALNATSSRAAAAASFGLDTGQSRPMSMFAEVLKSTQLALPVAKKYHLDRYKIKFEKQDDVDKILKVKTDDKSATLTLTTVAPTASLAPQIANDLCLSLSDFVRDAAISDRKNTTTYLSRRIKEVEGQLRINEVELKRFQEANRIAGATGANGAFGGTVGATLVSKFTEITADMRANEARISEVRRQMATQIGSPYRLNDNTELAKKWRDQLNEKTHELAVAEVQYGPEHPQVVTLKNDIRDIRAQIAREVSASRYSLNADISPELAGLLAERKSLQAQRNTLSSMLDRVPNQEMKIGNLMRQSTLLTSLYVTLQQKYQDAQLAALNDPSRFIFLDKPSVPRKPSSPRWRRNLALGGLAGLLLGICLAFAFPDRRTSRSHLRGATRPLEGPIARPED